MKYPKRSQYKYAKSRYQVRNWAEYEAGLQKRGDLTVWLSDAALEAWHAPASGKPGGQRIYADIAIEAALTIRMVFHLPLRQTEGFLRSLAQLLEIKLPNGLIPTRGTGDLSPNPSRATTPQRSRIGILRTLLACDTLERWGCVCGTVKIGGREGTGEGIGLKRRGFPRLADTPPAGPASPVWASSYQFRLWSKSSSGTDSGTAGSNSGLWSKSSGRYSCATSSGLGRPRSRRTSVWGGPRAGCSGGGEVGSPM